MSVPRFHFARRRERVSGGPEFSRVQRGKVASGDVDGGAGPRFS
jgi:hypothetical protein